MFAADAVSVISSSFQIWEETQGRRGDDPTLIGPPLRLALDALFQCPPADALEEILFSYNLYEHSLNIV